MLRLRPGLRPPLIIHIPDDGARNDIGLPAVLGVTKELLSDISLEYTISDTRDRANLIIQNNETIPARSGQETETFYSNYRTMSPWSTTSAHVSESTISRALVNIMYTRYIIYQEMAARQLLAEGDSKTYISSIFQIQRPARLPSSYGYDLIIKFNKASSQSDLEYRMVRAQMQERQFWPCQVSNQIRSNSIYPEIKLYFRAAISLALGINLNSTNASVGIPIHGSREFVELSLTNYKEYAIMLVMSQMTADLLILRSRLLNRPETTFSTVLDEINSLGMRKKASDATAQVIKALEMAVSCDFFMHTADRPALNIE